MKTTRTITLVAAAVAAIGGLSPTGQATPVDAQVTAERTSDGTRNMTGQSWREAANTRVATELVNGAFVLRDPEKYALRHIVVDYIQHNPGVPNGRTGFITAIKAMIQPYPRLSYSIKRTVAQGDLVVVQALAKYDAADPNDRGLVVVDTFRFDSRGKIVEHWDALQAVAESSLNGNPQV